MTAALLRRSLPWLLLALAAPAARAADDAEVLLARMNQAVHRLDYDGTFVYLHGEQLDSLRIVHKAGNGGARERLVSLNGPQREIIRNDREVRCYLPDENAVMVEHRRADRRNFPALLPESVGALNANYLLNRGKDGRVAGRKAVSVSIKPRDAYRYGYQLWADEATGLLLKASLTDEHGAVIEQYMFTQVAIGKPIPEAELKPRMPLKGALVQPAEPDNLPAADFRWTVTQPPPGFAATARMLRRLPGHAEPVEHLVYSDGLAVVSVFVERRQDTAKAPALTGTTHMGALNAYGRVVDGHRVTVMGEAPAATVSLIGDSVAAQH